MTKLNITDDVLDKLGFSEYWDEHGTWGGRTLSFSNGTRFRIQESCKNDDGNEGYVHPPTYIANHYIFSGGFAIPSIDGNIHKELFFLHEMYEVVKEFYPDCLVEFVGLCRKKNMGPYIDWYLADMIAFHASTQRPGIIKPLFNRVVIEPIDGDDKETGNIVMPDTVENTPRKGRVVAAGDDCKACKVGDMILRHQDSGDHLIIDGKQYLIMPEADVYAII